MSAGGEWGGAALLTVEHAPLGRRGFFGSFPQIGVPTGMALATIFMLILSSVLTTEQFLAWGWRIPFLSSVILIVIGYFIRRAVEESPAFEEMQELKKDSSAPLTVLFKNHWRTVLKCAMIFAANNAIGYFLIAYFISYGTKYIGYERTPVLAVSLIGAGAWLVSTMYFGKLSDKFGRKRTFIIGYIALAVWCVPMWLLIDTGNIVMFAIAVVVLGFLLGPTYGQCVHCSPRCSQSRFASPVCPLATQSDPSSAAHSHRCSQKSFTPPTEPPWRLRHTPLPSPWSPWLVR